MEKGLQLEIKNGIKTRETRATKTKGMHTVTELGASVPAFLGKLWKLVEDPDTDDLICWSPVSFHLLVFFFFFNVKITHTFNGNDKTNNFLVFSRCYFRRWQCRAVAKDYRSLASMLFSLHLIYFFFIFRNFAKIIIVFVCICGFVDYYTTIV